MPTQFNKRYVAASVASIAVATVYQDRATEHGLVRILPKILPILMSILHLQDVGGAMKEGAIRDIQSALIFSAVGDALLIFSANDFLFVLGIIAFGVAHLAYIKSFGWKKRSYATFLFATAIQTTVQFNVLAKIENSMLFTATSTYAVVIATMLWRCLDYSLDKKNSKAERIQAALGGVSFIMSDCLLAVCEFYPDGLPYSPILVLSSYYYAQYFMTARGIANASRKKE